MVYTLVIKILKYSVIVTTILFIVFGLASVYRQYRYYNRINAVKSSSNYPTATIYSFNTPLGSIGYTSSSVQSYGRQYTVQVIPSNLKPMADANFPCEPRKITAYKGGFVLELDGLDVNKSTTIILDKLDLGQREVSYSVNDQDGTFAKLEPLSKNPLVEGVGLAIRLNCYNSKFELYGVDQKSAKVIRYIFKRKNGDSKDFILIPFNKKIPQRDQNSNIIEDAYDQTSGKHIKTRYEFVPEANYFSEIETYVQNE
jgi:hypothetical protein